MLVICFDRWLLVRTVQGKFVKMTESKNEGCESKS